MSEPLDPASETAPLPGGEPSGPSSLPNETVASDPELDDAGKTRPPSWKDRLKQGLKAHEKERGDSEEGVTIPLRSERFRPLRELGRGGMGVVLEAEDTALGRRVALKVLRDGEFATPHALERFNIEARAAARLRHPNIVGVLEVGEASGQRFLVMDMIDGESLAARIQREGPLEPAEAARIGLGIAKALAYAHSHAILHRDVKPANVLLTKEGEPLLTDFGLAKDIERSQQITKSGHAMGTPAYMPPEQAEGEQERIDRRSDVYSLGATIYEMLTGRPPFVGSNVVSVLRSVLSDEPIAPSKLGKGLRVDKDLETICLECLEKEPERRYGSAGDLAADLERYLNSEPVLARPPSVLERFGKWRRRNQAVAKTLSASAVLLVLVVVVGSALFFRRLQREKEIAEAAAREARDALDLFVFEVQEQLGDLNSPNAREARNRLLAFAVEKQLRLEQLEEAAGRRRATIQGPSAYRQIGDLALEAGQSEVAEESYLQSLELSKALYEERPKDVEVGRNLALSLMKVGRIQHVQGSQDQALLNYDGALALLRSLPQDDPEVVRLCCFGLIESADVLRDQGKTEEAMRRVGDALIGARALRKSMPKEAEFLRLLSVVLDRQSVLHKRAGKLDDAQKVLTESLAISRKLRELFPGKNANRDLYVTCTRLGDLALQRADLPSALKAYEEALVLARQAHEADPTSARGRRDLSYCLQQLGHVRGGTGDAEGALAGLEESLTLARGLVRLDPENADSARGLATVLDLLGDLHRGNGNLALAGSLYGEALEISRKLANADRTNQQAQRDLVVSLLNVGTVQRLAGELEAAEASLVEAVKRGRAAAEAMQTAGYTDDLVNAVAQLARVLGLRGRTEDALGGFKEALKLNAQLLEAAPASFAFRRHRAKVLVSYGQLLYALGRFDEALARHDEAIVALRELRVRAPDDLTALRGLGDALVEAGDDLRRLGRAGEARERYAEAVGLRRQAMKREPQPELQRELAVSLSSLALVQDDPQELLATHQEVLAIHRAILARSPKNSRFTHDVAVALTRLAYQHARLGDHAATLPLWKEAVELLRGNLARNPESALAAEDLGLFLSQYGDAQMKAQQFEPAGASFREALRTVQPLGLDRESVRKTRMLSLLQLGSLHFRARDVDGARRYWTEGLQAARERQRLEPGSPLARRDVSIALMKVFNIYRVTSDLPRALQTIEECVANHRVLVKEHPRYGSELAQFEQMLAGVREQHDLMAGKRPAGTPKERLEVAYYFLNSAPDAKRALKAFRAALEDAATAANAQHVYNAACAAGRVLAQGDDPALRKQALAWLKQELSLRRASLKGLSDDQRTLAEGDLKQHKARVRQDADLAPLRNEAEFKTLFGE